MGKQLIILEKNQLALLYENGKLLDLFIEHEIYNRHDIYGGKVTSILPSLDAAFIVLNKTEKNGFLHVEDNKLLSMETIASKDQVIQEKKNILVQIKRGPTGTKGPSLTSDLHLFGRYIKIFPRTTGVNIEKDYYSERDKTYLKAIGHLVKPINVGLLIKNQIKETSIDFLIEEATILRLRWKKALYRSKFATRPGIISKKKKFSIKALMHAYDSRLSYIGLDSKLEANGLKGIIERFYPPHPILIEYYSTHKTLTHVYNIECIIHDFMSPRININRGAYIVIEKTEALTAIDVNSGSFVRSSNSRSTSFWTNYLATIEISNQIKLRNIGGIIIIDFIDSTNQEDQMKILSHLSKLLQNHSTPSTIVQMSELGLVEITRSRHGQSIYDAFSSKCDMCSGSGYTTKILTINSAKNQQLSTQLTPSFSNVINI